MERSADTLAKRVESKSEIKYNDQNHSLDDLLSSKTTKNNKTSIDKNKENDLSH